MLLTEMFIYGDTKNHLILLLNAGLNVSTKRKNGNTAFHEMARKSYKNIFTEHQDLLAKYKIDLHEIKNDNNETPLDIYQENKPRLEALLLTIQNQNPLLANKIDPQELLDWHFKCKTENSALNPLSLLHLTGIYISSNGFNFPGDYDKKTVTSPFGLFAEKPCAEKTSITIHPSFDESSSSEDEEEQPLARKPRQKH